MFVSRDRQPIEDHSTPVLIVKTIIMTTIAVFVLICGWINSPQESTGWMWFWGPGPVFIFGIYWVSTLWLALFRELSRRRRERQSDRH